MNNYLSMKLDYWFELPSSLALLLEENTFLEEQNQARAIESCFTVFKL